jgi:hypothetical protein
MMCSQEDLEALAKGTLDDTETARVRAHVDGCAACRDELAWLKAETAWIARRRAASSDVDPEVWRRIAARIAEAATAAPPVVPSASAPATRRLRWVSRVAYGGLCAAAAAAVVLATWPGQIRHVPADLGRGAAQLARHSDRPDPLRTIADAEREYQEAAAVLEAQWKAERGKLPKPLVARYEGMIETTRSRVLNARAQAGDSVDGRMVVLDGYAEYVRSLQSVVDGR